MKTKLTIQMEQALYDYCVEQGALVVEEVTMPDDQGIVDTLSCTTQWDGHREWRCYELKVTKADFRSTAKLSFIGHYNYFVLPEALYQQVLEEIPAGVGILIYEPYAPDEILQGQLSAGTFRTVKKPRRQELQVAEEALTNRFMSALFREVRKAKQMEKGVRYFATKDLFNELKQRGTPFNVYGEENFYQQFVEEMQLGAIEELTEELAALSEEYRQLKNGAQVLRRPTEPLE